MPVQMIELEEVMMVEASDEALEASVGGSSKKRGNYYSIFIVHDQPCH
jgi:hypothetical protein